MTRKPVYHSFAHDSHDPPPHMRRYLVGNGTLEPTGSSLRLVTTDTLAQAYSDAQLDDYQSVPGVRFRWHPPLRLIVRARFSHPAGVLQGTAGFGFWNYPFLLPEAWLPSLPRAIWFFYASPPSNIKLDTRTPGAGWKAATIDTLRPSALLTAPLAPLVVPLMHSRSLYHRIWPRIQRALRVREAAIPTTTAMTDWHIYTIEWGRSVARFSIDGQPVLADAPAPAGPQCFVMWLDNQYLVVTPWGAFRWGLLAVPGRQWLEVAWLAIEPGASQD